MVSGIAGTVELYYKSIVSSRDFKIPKFDDYTLLHLDEKWILNDYIQSYKSIEPISEKSLINFIEQLISKTNNNVYISNGSLSNKFTDFFKISFLMTGKNTYEFKILNKRVIFFDNMSFLQLEKLILNSTLLITCHGAPTHVAASFNKTIVDIIDRSELDFFNKWTAHFRDYKFCLRANFIDLSKNILISLDS